VHNLGVTTSIGVTSTKGALRERISDKFVRQDGEPNLLPHTYLQPTTVSTRTLVLTASRGPHITSTISGAQTQVLTVLHGGAGIRKKKKEISRRQWEEAPSNNSRQIHITASTTTWCHIVTRIIDTSLVIHNHLAITAIIGTNSTKDVLEGGRGKKKKKGQNIRKRFSPPTTLTFSQQRLLLGLWLPQPAGAQTKPMQPVVLRHSASQVSGVVLVAI